MVKDRKHRLYIDGDSDYLMLKLSPCAMRALAALLVVGGTAGLIALAI